MMNGLVAFFRQDDGAVTVDWVVLTAAIVGLGFAVVTPIATGTTSVSQKTNSRITDVNVGYGNN
jgi:hypothetical protein